MPQQTELLERGSYQLGLELNARQLEQFQAYYRELADWNRRVNLTAVTEYREVQVKHFLDSLSLYSVCAGGPTDGLKVVDVGAGAGFPGLPLKLALPDIQLTLVESVGKKARFLEHLVRALGLSGVDVLTGRAEALAHDAELRESFDLAVSRGVAKLPVLLEYTLPFCRIGGTSGVPETERRAGSCWCRFRAGSPGRPHGNRLPGAAPGAGRRPCNCDRGQGRGYTWPVPPAAGHAG